FLFLFFPYLPPSTFFPYTTLFRSRGAGAGILPRPLRRHGKAIPLRSLEPPRHEPAAARASLARPPPARSRGDARGRRALHRPARDRKSTRLNSSHVKKSYAVFCLK